MSNADDLGDYDEQLSAKSDKWTGNAYGQFDDGEDETKGGSPYVGGGVVMNWDMGNKLTAIVEVVLIIGALVLVVLIFVGTIDSSNAWILIIPMFVLWWYIEKDDYGWIQGRKHIDINADFK